jgi:hypothetical protein
MKAQAGDELVVKGRHVGDPDRTGVTIEVIGQALPDERYAQRPPGAPVRC